MTTPRDDIAGLSDELRALFLQSANATLDNAATQLDSLIKERDELQQVFDFRWEADQLAIKRWQEDHPERKTTWPDHADMVVWLLKERDALYQRLDAAAQMDREKTVRLVDAESRAQSEDARRKKGE